MHEPITADPDVQQAVDDLIELGDLERIRRLTVDSLRHPEGSPGRSSLKREADRLMDDITTRGERIGVSGAALFELAVAEASARSRRGRGQPVVPTSRTLSDAYQVAIAHEAECRRAHLATGKALETAMARRRATEEAYELYNAGRVRG